MKKELIEPKICGWHDMDWCIEIIFGAAKVMITDIMMLDYVD